MITFRADYINAARTIEGDACITLTVDDSVVQELEQLKGKPLVIDLKKYSEKRSLNANAYFWKLCDMIAGRLGSDKDTIYLLMLKRYGVWEDVIIPRGAEHFLKSAYRYIETLEDDEASERITVRCTLGSSQYDTAEMSRLISGTVDEAHGLGLSTWSDDEIKHVLALWEGTKQ